MKPGRTFSGSSNQTARGDLETAVKLSTLCYVKEGNSTECHPLCDMFFPFFFRTEENGGTWVLIDVTGGAMEMVNDIRLKN